MLTVTGRLRMTVTPITGMTEQTGQIDLVVKVAKLFPIIKLKFILIIKEKVMLPFAQKDNQEE